MNIENTPRTIKSEDLDTSDDPFTGYILLLN